MKCKYHLLYVMVLLLSLSPASNAQDHDHGEKNTDTTAFTPVTIERRTAIEIAGQWDEVFQLLEPRNRRLWSKMWASGSLQTYFAGEAKEPAGQMLRLLVPGYEHGGQSWHLVSDYDPGRRFMRIVALAPDIQLLIREVQCEADGLDSRATVVTIKWRVVGLSHKGNRMVMAFTDEQFDELMRTYEAEINGYLRDRKPVRTRAHEMPSAFQPVAIERRHNFILPASADSVFKLISPEAGNHWLSGTPNYLFGGNTQLGGALYPTPHRGLMVIGEHNPEKRRIRNVFYIPDTEFMLEELSCQDTPEGARVDVTWRVVGISEDGNQAVQDFFDKQWQRRMKSTEMTYKQLARNL